MKIEHDKDRAAYRIGNVSISYRSLQREWDRRWVFFGFMFAVWPYGQVSR